MTHKNLNDVILEVYKPKSPDEQKFVDKHVTIKHKDRNGNGDDVFKGNTKYIKRKEERHGYDVGEDEKVYESIEELEEAIEDKEDVPFAGPYKNTGARKDQYGNTIKNVAKHLAKKAMNAQKMKEDADLREAPLLGRGMSPEARARDIEQSELTGEEVEELGEVLDTRASKMSYAQKNMDSHKKALDDYVHYDGEGQNADKKADAHKTAMKRVRGLNTFVKNRVTKEEVEDIDSLLDEALDLLNSIDEKTLTQAELRKREEIVKAVRRGDPRMDKSIAYAIATKAAKRVAEESEEIEESLPGSYSRDVTMTSPRSASWSAGLGAGWRPKETEPAPVINRRKYRPGSMKRALTKEELVKERAGDPDDDDHSGVYGVQQRNGRYKNVRIKRQPDGKYHIHHADGSKGNTDLKGVKSYISRNNAMFKEETVNEDGASAVLRASVARSKLRDMEGKNKSPKLVSMLKARIKAAGPYYDKPIKEEVNLTEETIDYNNYTITSSPHSSPKHELGVAHVSAAPGKMKALGIHTEKGGWYGRTSHVTVTNKTTGERSQHNVYQREWGDGGLTASIRSLHKHHPEHDKVLHHFLTGRKTVNPLRTPQVSEETEEARNARRGAFRTNLAKAISKGQGNKFLDDKNKGRLASKDIKEENLDELRAATIDSYRKKAYDQQPAGDDGSQLYKKRKTGRDLAFKKVTHGAKIMATEEETLDELSKDTVKRYKDTATKNLDYHSTAWDNIAQADANAMSFTKAQGASFKKHDSESEKRYKGIKMANKKLAKEDIQNENLIGKQHKIDKNKNGKIDAHDFELLRKEKAKKITKEDIIDRAYERYVPEEVKYTPHELFANRLEGLSESHAVTLINLFESLSRENQAKMTQDAKTDEGLNKLLNFAIENRGE